MRRPLLLLSVLAMLPNATQAQQVRARVIDADQRRALADVHVLVIDSVGRQHADARTDSNGFFTIERLAPASYSLILEQDGYGTVRQPLVIRGSDPMTLPAILMQSEAVVLDAVRAEAEARSPGLRGGDGVRAEFVLAGSRLAELEKVNASAAAVYRELGVRVRESVTPAGRTLCIQSRRGPTSMRGGGGTSTCDPVAVVVDGMVVSDGMQVLRHLKIGAWESIEYLTAVEAAQRFGLQASSSGGSIVLWTRGLGPHRSPARDDGSR